MHSQQTRQQTPPSVFHPRFPPSDCAPSSRSLTPPFPCSLAQVKKTLRALAQQSIRKASDARRRASGPSSPSTSSSTWNPPSRPSPSPPDTQQRTSRPPDLRSSLKKRELSTPPPPFALPSTPSPAPSSATGPPPLLSPQAAGSAAAAGRSTSLIRQAAERARTQRHLEISRLEDSEEVGTGGRERGRAEAGALGSSTSRVLGESSYLFPPRERVRSFLLHLHCRSTSRKGLI